MDSVPASVLEVTAHCEARSQPAEARRAVEAGSVNSDRLLGTRRAALIFASTVFLTTVIQVVAVPVTALIDGRGDWPLSVPIPVGFALLVLGCALQASAFLLSDRWPHVTVMMATAVYLALALGLSAPSWLISMYLVVALSLFLLASRRPATVSLLWLVGVVTVTVSALFVWAVTIGASLSVAIGFATGEAVRFAAPAIAGTALGVWWGVQTRRVALARAEAETARREHDRRVEEAQQAERARIAQELHDVAGQHLAGLITLADAALTIAPTRPAEALSLVEEVRNEGRFAAASLAGALADLRAVGAEPREATKDLRQADTLIEYWRRRGMKIGVTAAGPIDELPAVISTTAYRCMQEAITNAAKHSPGAEVAVDLVARSDRLEVAVANASPPTTSEPIPGLGLGWGLSGIRERVDLLRGTLVFGTTPEGGWVVRFVIPVAQPD